MKIHRDWVKPISLAICFIILPASSWGGPHAPPAGQAGSSAVSATDLSIVGWATGYENMILGPGTSISEPDPFTGASYGPELTLGPSDATGSEHPVLPLGQAGQITLTFDQPISDGEGYDIAVFENSFSSTFLELAFIEVSSNGVDFFRFPSESLTTELVNSFNGQVDATDIDGLAGKYAATYGTPFDLSELQTVSPLLNTSAVTHVRIVDILGDGNTFDTQGNPIYDPYPTATTAGFDLDAVGVLHQAADYTSSIAVSVSDVLKRGPGDDADEDGCSNAMEYALGTDAGDPQSKGVFQIDMPSGNAPVFSFSRDRSAYQAELTILWKADLSSPTWSSFAEKPVGENWQSLVTGVHVNEDENGNVTATDTRSGLTKGFFQLEVTL